MGQELNLNLRQLFEQTGWTLGHFAREVNRVGTEGGRPRAYSAQTVHQWLRGHFPKTEARPLILEALSRKLGRSVTHAEAGFPAPESTSAKPNTVEGLIDLGMQDMDPSRRSVISASLFSVALTVPGWPDVVGRMESVQAGETRRVGTPEVEMVTAMTERLSALDDEFGGRHARPMAAAFLVNAVAPYLRAPASDAVRRKMMGAASFLCYLTGWMAVDEGLHGLAQRYYVKGLELAGASDNHSTYCHILRGMSVQATDLGNGSPAVRLADAAAAAAPNATPRMRAFLAGQQAHAHAVRGDKRAAYHFLRETDSAIEKAESTARTFGGYSPATLAYHEAQVRNALGDTKGSIDSLRHHFRLRVSGNESRRSGMRFTSMLAERQLKAGHLEAACANWSKVLDEYPTIKSGQVDQHMVTMLHSLHPHLKNRTARELHERARFVIPNSLAI
ncbi:tetratricopeptide repeat protein [Streptomyces sp. 5-10]|uniref:tetratricopeptide repeat protein n=1 Tax=Streptomyces sp. 5-10 TaxID=878925 RepID=UPI00168B6781|nr:tetratricopeptide repeat protein [Streptomyces sp. 5-10]MBD3004892.1 tetratricopeptide repeat protein [Streptomyces sp. 5-10]